MNIGSRVLGMMRKAHHTILAFGSGEHSEAEANIKKAEKSLRISRLLF